MEESSREGAIETGRSRAKESSIPRGGFEGEEGEVGDDDDEASSDADEGRRLESEVSNVRALSPMR